MKKNILKNIIRIAALFILAATALLCFSSCNADPRSGKKIEIVITVKDYGEIRAVLLPEVAPKTVENFQKLIGEKYFDGTIFHRVIEDFMIQGGDGFYAGKSEPTPIVGEFSSNGYKNNLKHERGVLSMARTNDPNSATSQFFICHDTKGCEHLDGEYAAFGYVTSGMEVVDEIARVKTDSSDMPTSAVIIESIRLANEQ